MQTNIYTKDYIACIPVICEETGYYGGELSVLAKDEKSAFRMLEQAIRDGVVKRKQY